MTSELLFRTLADYNITNCVMFKWYAIVIIKAAYGDDYYVCRKWKNGSLHEMRGPI